MKNLVSFIILTISILALSAQTNLFTLTGKVVEEDGKTPLPYANVMLKGTPYGDITNTKGVFRFSVPAVDTANGTVQISFVGYQTKTVAVKDLDKPIRIKNNAIELKEFTKTEYITPDALLKEVVRRIPENYHTDTLVSNYYCRDWRTLNDSVYFFLEAPYIIRNDGYVPAKKYRYGQPNKRVFCPIAFRYLMDTNYVFSLVYKDENNVYTLLCEWNVCSSPNDLVHELVKKGSSRFLETLYLSQFSDGVNEYYKIKAYNNFFDTSKADYLTTLIINKSDFAITDITIQQKDPDKKYIGKFLMSKTPMESIYHNKDIRRIQYRKVNGRYLLYSFIDETDDFITVRDSYVSKGMVKYLSFRHNKVFIHQGLTGTTINDTTNLCFEGVKIAKDRYLTPYFTQYHIIPQDTLRYGKDWKKGYTIPQLDLDIQNQLKRRGINP